MRVVQTAFDLVKTMAAPRVRGLDAPKVAPTAGQKEPQMVE